MSTGPEGGASLRVGLVVVLALVGVTVLPTAARADDPAWREVLERAATAAREVSYAGEALWVIRSGDVSHVVTTEVRNDPGGMMVGDPQDVMLWLGSDGEGLLDSAEGWHVPLPPIDAVHDDLGRITDKYDVAVAGDERIADRPCTVVEIHRRGERELRERLWLDDDTGLLVRRETFEEGEEPVRMVAYLSLDLRRSRRVEGASASRRERGDDPRGSVRDQGVTAVDDRGLAALREAGWLVPEELPGGFAPLGAFVVSSDESQPLQLVYGDGLYVVSVFQQDGHPDWSSLPPGAQQVEGLGWTAYEWPGAVPHRLVWEAQGRTWSLVSDAPPQELLGIAEALPQPSQPSLWQRLRRGGGRLWSLVSG